MNSTLVNYNVDSYTVRQNPLLDIEFNIISDTIKCESLKNNLNLSMQIISSKLNHTPQ